MAWTNTKTAIVACAGVLLAAGTVVIVSEVQRAQQRKRQATPVAAQPARAAKPAASTTEPAAPTANPRSLIWAAERKAEAERIKARAQVNETTNATTIDLKPYITAKLTDGPFGWKGNDDDNLSELPPGQHIYAGVPFDVSGSVQLIGGWLKRYKKPYPAEATGIPIDRTCARLHLLHGNGFIINTNFGTVVAKLVIHYADGSSRDLKLVAGENAFDWWAPLFKSGIPERWLQMAPGTERAWTGSNPYVRKWQPDLSLVLYRTTFQNPQPEIKVASVDYVSAQTVTSPFLVGLTVD
jgi:hypothetical protein